MDIHKITNLFQEIEFYESLGYFKTADNILQKIIRLSYEAAAADLGDYFADWLAKEDRNAFLEFMRGIPECEAAMSLGTVDGAFVSMSLSDYVTNNFRGNLRDTVTDYQKNITTNSPYSDQNSDLLKKCLDQVFRKRDQAQKTKPEESGAQSQAGGGQVPPIPAG